MANLLAAGAVAMAPAVPARAETPGSGAPKGQRAALPPVPARDLPPAPGPLDNPLKGWAAYAEDWARHHQPVSMAYLYVPWRLLEPEPGRFDFEGWERRAWDHPLARDKHIVFRVYLDYPGQPTGVPQWLLDSGVALTPYRDAGGERRGNDSAGQSPDYADQRLVEGLERLIAAMGARYDRNPRVAFIAVGLLGHWGEWHTYPREDLAPPPATRQRVLDAYRAAFPTKKVLARYPRDETAAATWLGFHDDAFPDSTGGRENWHFLNQLHAAGREDTWRHQPIAAEMVPNAAPRLLGPDYGKTLSALLRAHVTWIGPYNPALEGDLDAARRKRAEGLVRRMGYTFRLRRAWLPPTVAQGGEFRFAVELSGVGLAPFYYPWPVEWALIAEDGTVAARLPVEADPRQWLADTTRISAGGRIAVPRGRYAMGFGVVDPWRGRAAIGFANALPRRDGWTILGDVAVE